MTHAKLYLKLAEQVAGINQYTCHLFTGNAAQQEAMKAYQMMFIPGREDYQVCDAHYWWSDGLSGTNNMCGRVYAHNARAIALLLAHEMAKTGDMPA